MSRPATRPGAAVGSGHRREHADGGRLAGAVGPQHSEDASGGHLEVDAVHRDASRRSASAGRWASIMGRSVIGSLLASTSRGPAMRQCSAIGKCTYLSHGKWPTYRSSSRISPMRRRHPRPGSSTWPCELFTEQGYDATSLRQIADAPRRHQGGALLPLPTGNAEGRMSSETVAQFAYLSRDSERGRRMLSRTVTKFRTVPSSAVRLADSDPRGVVPPVLVAQDALEELAAVGAGQLVAHLVGAGALVRRRGGRRRGPAGRRGRGPGRASPASRRGPTRPTRRRGRRTPRRRGWPGWA